MICVTDISWVDHILAETSVTAAIIETILPTDFQEQHTYFQDEGKSYVGDKQRKDAHGKVYKFLRPHISAYIQRRVWRLHVEFRSTVQEYNSVHVALRRRMIYYSILPYVLLTFIVL